MLNYRIFIDGKLIYSPYDDTYKMYDAKLELNQNDISTFEFTLLESKTLDIEILRMKSQVDVYQGDKRIFKGIVIEDDRSMDNEVSIKCKDDLYYLAQTLQRPASYGSNSTGNRIIVNEDGDEVETSDNTTVTVPVAGIFKDYIAKHNTESTQKFKIGNVEIEAQGVVENTDYKTTWDAISALITDYGGFLDYQLNGDDRILSWLKDFTQTAEQEARFSSNLTDVQINETALDMATVLIPTGDTVESSQVVTNADGDEEQVSTSTVTSIKDVNGGLDYIQDDKAVAKYGRIMKHKSYTGITDPKALLEVAKTDLAELVKHTQSITVKMIDLAGVDDAETPIFLGKYIVINDPVNNIHDKYLPLKISRDLFNPENNEIELTATRQTQSATAFNGTLNSASTGLVASTSRRDSEYMDIIKAQKGYIDELHTKTLDVEYLLTAYKGKFKVLEADSAKIKDLETDFLQVNGTANINKANIDTLNAKVANIDTLTNGYARIGVLDNDLANIKSLLAGNVNADGIQSIVINSQNSTIANGVITNAMIQNLSFDKITGFDINTTKLTIHSADGKSTWKDNTILIKDGNSQTRVQLGKDAQGDYNLYLYDKSGKVLFDPLGLTADGINRQVIDNDAVMDDAMIAGSKLDIDSVIKEVNGATTTLKSSRIYFDDKAQSLNAYLNKLETTVTDTGNSVSTLSTQLEASNGQISSLITKTDTTNKTISSATTDIASLVTKTDTTNKNLSTANGNIASLVNKTDATNKSLSDNVTTINGKIATVNSNLDATNKNLNDNVSAINGKISNINVSISSMNTSYNSLKQTVDSNKLSIGSITTNVTTLTDKANKLETNLTQTSSRLSTLDQSLSGFKTTVSETYSTKTELSNLSIGGRNLFEKSGKLTSGGDCLGQSGSNISVTDRTTGTDAKMGSGQYIACKISDPGGGGVYLKGDFGNYTQKLKGGEVYTVSVYAKASKNCTAGAIHAEWMDRIDNVVAPNYSTEWQRYIVTGRARANPTGNLIAIIFYPPANTFSDTVFYVSSPQVELGNKATDWSPAPEDTTQLIDDTKVALSTSITQTASGIRTEVASTYADKAKMISYINQSPESIKIQANRIDIDGLVTFNNSNNAIANKIKSDINNVQVGGTNLCLNSAHLEKINLYGNGVSVKKQAINDGGNYDRPTNALKITLGKGNAGFYFGSNYLDKLVDGHEYVVSMYICCQNRDFDNFNFVDCEWMRNKVWISNPKNDRNYEQRIAFRGTYYKDAPYNAMTFYPGNISEGETYWISAIQVEEGNKLTAWSPAPEDVDASVADAKKAGTDAQTAASNAQSTANTAVSNAKTAQDTANSANKKATATDLLVSNWCNLNDKTLIDGSKIYTGTITADKLNVNEMQGTNGVIYLKDGTFDYGNGRLKWDGSNLSVNGNITATTGQIASFTIRGAYLESTDEQVGLSAGNTSFWAGFNGNDGSYKFRVTKDGYVYASNADISGTISNSLIKWRSGAGDFGTIEARSSLMANGSGIPGQESRGMIIAGYLGSTIDIGIRGNENNSLENYAWYSAIHINGNSTVIRNPGTDISSYMMIAGSKITIDANASSQAGGLCTGMVEVHGGNGYYTIADWMRIYAHTAITGGLEVDGLINGNGLQTANMRSDRSGSYLEVKCANNSNAYGVSAWLSDARYKNSIMNTKVNASSILRRIAFKQFNWNDSGIHVDIGLIAQDLQCIDPSFVMKINQPDGSYTYQVNDVMMTTLTAKAVQETISEVDSLKLENMNLKARLSYLEEKVKFMNNEKSSYSEV